MKVGVIGCGAAAATHLDALARVRGVEVVALCDPVDERRHAAARRFGVERLGLMRPTALLVNTARGALVDELALATALTNGSIAGAGVDVFSQEPLDPAHPLRRCPNVLLTPHTAGETREAMERMVALMLDNLLRVDRDDPPRCLLNGGSLE